MDFLINTAHAQGAPPAGGGFEFLIMIGIFFAIMYFMIIRPQSKRAKEHKSLLESLSKGDEVVTTGGILGKVTALDENFITLKISAGVDVQIQRQAVTSVMPKGTMKKH
ncbi:MAG: preprotein translocase subunit YajC [Thiothrix sp.]|nr:MAG: preprotein translocase subunit YajC [Thiothrix sp.]